MANQPVELTFHSVGDCKGVFYFLGTNGGKTFWRNPAEGKSEAPVEVQASSAQVDSALTNVTDKEFRDQIYRSNNVPNSWVAVDLRDYEVNIAVYSMAHAHGDNTRYLRSWTLQGSRDGKTYEDVDVRNNDTALSMKSPWMAFAVTPSDKYYRFVRVMMKPGGNTEGSHHLTLNCFELYGKLRRAPSRSITQLKPEQAAQHVQAYAKTAPHPLRHPHKLHQQPAPKVNNHQPALAEKSYRWGSSKGDGPPQGPSGHGKGKGSKGGDKNGNGNSAGKQGGKSGFKKGGNEKGDGFKGAHNGLGNGFKGDKGKGDGKGMKGMKGGKGGKPDMMGFKGGKGGKFAGPDWGLFRNGQMAKGKNNQKGTMVPGGRGSFPLVGGKGRGRGTFVDYEQKDPEPQEALKCPVGAGTTKFSFNSVDDHKGVVFYLGCDSGKSKWSNPCTSGKVNVTASSVAKGKPFMAVDHTFIDQIFYTKNQPDSWIQVDLKGVKVVPTHYIFSQRALLRDFFPRTWTFEGSTDGKDFTVIKSYTNDRSFNEKAQTCSFQVTCKQAYSIFRIKLAENGNSKETSALVVSCFDVYGSISKK
ncbi:BTB/POZ domain-containing protein [Diplonema papillatum]|nr:BTB/POZ domain-containing protein [Diplonema papillatum]